MPPSEEEGGESSRAASREERVLSPSSPDVLRAFRRRSPADSRCTLFRSARAPARRHPLEPSALEAGPLRTLGGRRSEKDTGRRAGLTSFSCGDGCRSTSQ